jgi:hypothetical protein
MRVILTGLALGLYYLGYGLVRLLHVVGSSLLQNGSALRRGLQEDLRRLREEDDTEF